VKAGLNFTAFIKGMVMAMEKMVMAIEDKMKCR